MNGRKGGRNVRNVQSMICKALSERFQTVKMPKWVCVPIWRVRTVEIKLIDTSTKLGSLFKNPESVLMNRKCFNVRVGFRKKRKVCLQVHFRPFQCFEPMFFIVGNQPIQPPHP